jgi:hypothetical protein
MRLRPCPPRSSPPFPAANIWSSLTPVAPCTARSRLSSLLSPQVGRGREAGQADGEPAGRRRRPAPVEDAATIARNRRLFGVLLVGQLSKAASSNEAEAGRRARTAAALAEQEAAAKAQRGPRPREWSAERGRERDGAASASAVRSKETCKAHFIVLAQVCSIEWTPLLVLACTKRWRHFFCPASAALLRR